MFLPLCRVCLAGDVSYSVRDVQLRETYERLAGAKFYSVDEIPLNLCYFCYWQLRKYSNFTAQARSSHNILKEAIKYGDKVGLQHIQNLPKKCHLTISAIKTLSLHGNIQNLPKKRHLSISTIKTLSLHGNIQNLPKKRHLSISTVKTLSLDGNIKIKSKKEHKEKKKVKKIMGEHLNDSLEPLSTNIQNLKSTMKNSSPSSLELLLRGNPELTIKKQKRAQKFEIVKQKNIEIETEYNEIGMLSPNIIQSTEKNAQSDQQMIEEYIDVDYDRHDDDETLYPCHKSNKIFSTETNLTEHNKNHNKQNNSNIKETKVGTKIYEFEKGKKDADSFNRSGGQVFIPVAHTSPDIVFRPAADTSPDIVFRPAADTSTEIVFRPEVHTSPDNQNLNMVAECLEIESDSIFSTNLIVNNQDDQVTVYQIEENVDHHEMHTKNTQIETPSIKNVSEICEIETITDFQSKNIFGTINSASKLHSTVDLENVTDELIYKCNFCKNLFSTKEKRDKHEKSHTSSIVNTKVRRYTCKECGHKFVSAFHLVDHSRKHTNERPFTCEICGKSFRLLTHLLTHFIVHKKPKHVCHICNKSFTTRGYMFNYHMNTHFNLRPFVCHVCKKDFQQSGTLWEHIRNVHQGVRRYACDICGLKIDSKSHLARHMITHSGIKAFSCDYCKMNFATKGTMRRHVTLYCKMK